MNLLSVVATIKAGEEQDLRNVLQQIQADLVGNPYVLFPRSQLTHFARWTIIRDDDHGARLLFTADHDGGVDAYLDELRAISPGLDEIWGRCKGYTGAPGFLGFMKRNLVKTRGYFIAFPDETVQTVRTKIAVRQQIEDFLRLPHVSPYLSGHGGAATFLDRLSGIYPTALSPPLWRKARQARREVDEGLRSGFLSVLLPVARWIIQAQQAHSYNRVTSACGEGIVRRPPAPAETAGQTSFTVFASVKRGRGPWLRLLLAATRLFARYGYPPGNFADVFTLHSFRWLLIDNDKRIIFQSIFDGSWENYMGDFIDKIVWALDFVYTNTEGYRPAGMREVVAFKDWIRDHQPKAEVVYNAYPGETVLNLLRDRQIADALGTTADAAAVCEWLELL